MFSIPLNPKLSEEQFNKNFLPFMIDHRHVIYDFYFTSRIPPFAQDAMGDCFVADNLDGLIQNALYVQQTTGINASATFNNINISPKTENLLEFIRSFEILYYSGIRTATIPFTSWAMNGMIQYEFPNLKLKNTILQSVRNSQEVWYLCEAGFDYINLERTLMRNRDELKRIVDARNKYKDTTGKYVKLSLLANENCLGWCPIMGEHYNYNMQRTKEQSQFFNSPMSIVSCSTWDYEKPGIELKNSNLPPWKEDWDELKDLGIDVFKMHGRENVNKLYNTMKTVVNYSQGKEILFDDFNHYSETIKDKFVSVWRKKIKNCKTECWDCGYCDEIGLKNREHEEKIKFLLSCIKNANVYESKCSDSTFEIPTLSSDKILCLLNNVVSKSKTHLEVGTLLGATFAASLENNETFGICIDNWKINELHPIIESKNPPVISKHAKNDFLKNMEKIKNKQLIIDSDIEKINLEMFGELDNKIDSIFYDGPMNFKYIKHIFYKLKSLLSNEIILILDDAKNQDLIFQFENYITEKYNIVYSKLIVGEELENADDWWSGIAIYYLTRR